MPGSKSITRSDYRPLADFALWLLVLCGLRLLIGLVEVPVAMIPLSSLAVSVLFVAAPVIALFRGAAFPWTWKSSLVAVLVGVGLQLGTFVLMRQVRVPMVAGIVDSLGQAGLITWCLGVGGLLSASLRDKNMLVPIAIFLALFDIWLVFVPEGPVGQIARGTQENLARIAYHIPAVATRSSGGFARNLAYIGPADFLFLGMFCVQASDPGDGKGDGPGIGGLFARRTALSGCACRADHAGGTSGVVAHRGGGFGRQLARVQDDARRSGDNPRARGAGSVYFGLAVQSERRVATCAFAIGAFPRRARISRLAQLRAARSTPVAIP